MLKHIETDVFASCFLALIVRSMILFMPDRAAPTSIEILIVDLDSGPEYCRWQRLESLKIIVDLRRIGRFGSGIISSSDGLISFSGFWSGND
jgi:hypothetical protein